MKNASHAAVETLRAMRFVVELLTSANSAVCAAQTAMRAAGQMPVIDIAAAVQAELRIASRRFHDAFEIEAENLDDDGADNLHSAVWQ